MAKNFVNFVTLGGKKKRLLTSIMSYKFLANPIFAKKSYYCAFFVFSEIVCGCKHFLKYFKQIASCFSGDKN